MFGKSKKMCNFANWNAIKSKFVTHLFSLSKKQIVEIIMEVSGSARQNTSEVIPHSRFTTRMLKIVILKGTIYLLAVNSINE